MSATKWGKKRLRGVEYDLSHLDPFLFEAVPGDPEAPRLPVVASFNSHAFTRKREPGDTPDLFFGGNGHPRSFCPMRHACSLHLPALIKSLATGKVYFTYDEKFLIFDHIPPVPGEYAAVFRMEKAESDFVAARMFVISAHERTNPLGAMKSISFYTLVRKIAAGEEIPWPKKK